jgi:hypothetical protein
MEQTEARVRELADPAILKQLEYWKTRCQLAEAYIEECPCDWDITHNQKLAYKAWQRFIWDKLKVCSLERPNSDYPLTKEEALQQLADQAQELDMGY